MLQKKIDALFAPRRIALLNAGIGGTGTAEHLAFLEDFGSAIAPQAVIVFVSIDDFNRAERSPLYRLKGTDDFQLVEGTVPTSMRKKLLADSTLYNFMIQHVHIAQLVRQAVIHVAFTPPPSPHRIPVAETSTTEPPDSLNQQRLARALFRRMKAWCDQRAIKFAVINIGWPRPGFPSPGSQGYPWLDPVLASENIATFDAAALIEPIITRDPNFYSIPGDGHPNPRGAALIADNVWPFIQRFVTTIN
jgi:lysophospholipase L1-like esterase